MFKGCVSILDDLTVLDFKTKQDWTCGADDLAEIASGDTDDTTSRGGPFTKEDNGLLLISVVLLGILTRRVVSKRR